jgi:hypothetical protein
MGIWNGIKEDAEKIKAEYEAAAGGVKSATGAVVADIKTEVQNVVAAFESLESQALGEVDKFTAAAQNSLAKLKDYEDRLQKGIAAKSNALAKVQVAIGKLQSVQPDVATIIAATGADGAVAKAVAAINEEAPAAVV